MLKCVPVFSNLENRALAIKLGALLKKAFTFSSMGICYSPCTVFSSVYCCAPYLLVRLEGINNKKSLLSKQDSNVLLQVALYLI